MSPAPPSPAWVRECPSRCWSLPPQREQLFPFCSWSLGGLSVAHHLPRLKMPGTGDTVGSLQVGLGCRGPWIPNPPGLAPPQPPAAPSFLSRPSLPKHKTSDIATGLRVGGAGPHSALLALTEDLRGKPKRTPQVWGSAHVCGLEGRAPSLRSSTLMGEGKGSPIFLLRTVSFLYRTLHNFGFESC